ncbi:cysteine desulfurase [Nocardioidaceae bacterium]|nr:cysteine desulfurase [Nocardioidaceae bacterium]
MSAYLDHAATSPVRPEVADVVARHLGDVGNAASLHGSGRRARRIVEESRELIAHHVGARPGEVVFTSGGTEADNLALKGAWWATRHAAPAPRRVLVSAVEHHAVLDPASWLERCEGALVEPLPVDRDGVVDEAAFAEAVAGGGVAAASVMWANNEVGAVQPVARLASLARRHGVGLHSDAVQALAHLPVDFTASGLDAMTLSAHKVGGPHGVGALVVRREAHLSPLLHGGGQERDLRSGTVPVPLVAGFAAAVEAAVTTRELESARLATLRDDLVSGVRAQVPDVVLNAEGAPRLPGVAHLSFPGCEGDSLLMLLDAAGVECSTGSACSAGVPEASHVLLAMGRTEAEARSGLRFSLGHTSTAADVAALAGAIGAAVERGRAAGSLRQVG